MQIGSIYIYQRLKKVSKALLICLLILGVILLGLSYAFFPRWVRSWVDFRSRPPYLPFYVPLQEDGAPSITTAYFVASEDDEPLNVFLKYSCANENDCRTLIDLFEVPRKKIPSTDSNGKTVYIDNENPPVLQRYKIEISEAVDGKEQVLFSNIIINPGGYHSTSLTGFRKISHTIHEDRIYKVQVTSEFIAPQINDLAQGTLRICQGCNGK